MYLTFVKISEIHEMKCENVLGIRCSNIWHTSTVWGGIGKLTKTSRLAIWDSEILGLKILYSAVVNEAEFLYDSVFSPSELT